MHIRHHSLYTPRDFDLSPYFQIVKPTLVYGFDYKAVVWGERDRGAAVTAAPVQPQELSSGPSR
jgi:hypothetical protein